MFLVSPKSRIVGAWFLKADCHHRQLRVDSGSSAATGNSRPGPVIRGYSLLALKATFDP